MTLIKNKDIVLAIEALKKGEPVFIYDADGREEETDIVMVTQFMKPVDIMRLRKDGGGLICSTVTDEIAEKMGLPFMVDVYRGAKAEMPLLEKMIPDHLPYDTKSAFSLTINHLDNYTGITDNDRSMTAAEFGKLVGMIQNGEVPEGKGVDEFTSRFRTPGHLHLLRSAKGLLDNRKGHTELATVLCMMAELSPSATICEMMGDDGRALQRPEAMKYAKDNGFVYLDGIQIIEEWNTWSE
ncbi:MAG: 3,4-dihydroxy-2-butanone-4-phosphate synthase [Thermoplasmata archaeon]|nr:3,4-dihydroxy-2-butanone-4-phosphate synthase [Thermoplasmata archaeon]